MHRCNRSNLIAEFLEPKLVESKQNLYRYRSVEASELVLSTVLFGKQLNRRKPEVEQPEN